MSCKWPVLGMIYPIVLLCVISCNLIHWDASKLLSLCFTYALSEISDFVLWDLDFFFKLSKRILILFTPLLYIGVSIFSPNNDGLPVTQLTIVNLPRSMTCIMSRLWRLSRYCRRQFLRFLHESSFKALILTSSTPIRTKNNR